MATSPLADLTALAVRSSRRDTTDIWTLELDAPDGAFAFAPGQFTMLSALGAGEVPISISGDVADPSTLVHTVRSVGYATRAICAARTGDVLTVRGPFGNSWPLEAATGRDVVVITGGIALAPLRAAVLQLLDNADRYGRLILLHGGRTPDQLLYEDELEAWRERGLDVATTVDIAGPEWLGHVGVVPNLVRRATFEGESAVAFVCGPEVMMRFTMTALERRGVTPDRMYLSVERNMQCGIGRCGHCQLGPTLICRDGPVYSYAEAAPWLAVREL